jgi:hypothetical protein
MLKDDAKVVLFLQKKRETPCIFHPGTAPSHCKNERTVATKVYLKGSYNQQQAGSVNSNHSQNNVVSCLSGQIR